MRISQRRRIKSHAAWLAIADLEELVQEVLEALGDQVIEVVLAVPAAFDDAGDAE
jgi:molecular chaperone DnaK (HSP70)